MVRPTGACFGLFHASRRKSSRCYSPTLHSSFLQLFCQTKPIRFRDLDEYIQRHWRSESPSPGGPPAFGNFGLDRNVSRTKSNTDDGKYIASLTPVLVRSGVNPKNETVSKATKFTLATLAKEDFMVKSRRVFTREFKLAAIKELDSGNR